MPRLIQDEFTMLNLSAQRKYQLRHERDGLCRLCMEKAVVGPNGHAPYCRKHGNRQAALQKNWKRSQADPQSLI